MVVLGKEDCEYLLNHEPVSGETFFSTLYGLEPYTALLVAARFENEYAFSQNGFAKTR